MRWPVGSQSEVLSIVLCGLLVVGGLATARAADTRITPGMRLHVRPAPAGRAAPTAPARATALAGSLEAPYHYGETLLCSDCHTMHFSQSHGYAGGIVSATPQPAGDWLPAEGPNTSLLKSSAGVLCLACHDGQTFAPDVVGSDTGGLTQRSAGFFESASTPSYRGHNLDPTLVSDPNTLCDRCHFEGSMATASVTCTDCHAHHGNGGYRNLQWASWPGAEPPIKAFIRPGSTGPARYEAANIAYPAPVAGDGSYREVTNICIDCHHSFFSPYYTDASAFGAPSADGKSPYHRHPGTNSEWGAYYPIGRTGANTDPVAWVDGTGPGFTIPRLRFIVQGASDFAGATVVSQTNEVFCLSCHKAHGSENAFATTWNYGQVNPAGCRQCHTL